MSDEVLSQNEIESLIAKTAEVTAQQPEAADQDQSQEAEQLAEAMTTAPPAIRVQTGQEPSVRTMDFGQINDGGASAGRGGMDLLYDVQLAVTVELGRTTLKVRDVLGLGPGAVVELDTRAGEPVEVVVNGKAVARGEVVVIDDNFGVRVTEIIDKEDRDARAKAA